MKKILIAGVARNCAATLENEILTLKNAFCEIFQIQWLIIESDSQDETVQRLSAVSEANSDFRYISLGALELELKKRTERLAFCRNVYLEEIRQNSLYSDLDYVVVADFDGVNTQLTKGGVLSCFVDDVWDVCTANQSGGYYDIWALRHPLWSPTDCWEQHRFLSHFMRFGTAEELSHLSYAAVYSKMICIPAGANWVEVQSAFGGLAIYKAKIIAESNYVGVNSLGDEICEHVALNFHLTLERGYKMFINPALINIDYVDHSAHLRPLDSV